MTELPDRHFKAACEFAEVGCTVALNYLPHESVMLFLEAVYRVRANAVDQNRKLLDRFDPLTVNGSGAEARAKQIILGDVLARECPAIIDLYEMVAADAGSMLGFSLEPAPREHWRSAVNANLYTRVGDGQGWHVDTNPISALLFLTDAVNSPLVVGERQPGREPLTMYIVRPPVGALVLLDGSRPHRVPPLVGAPRVNLAMNLYPPGTYSRPPHTDRLLYE